MSSEMNVMISDRNDETDVEEEFTSTSFVRAILDDIIDCTILSHDAGKLITWIDYMNTRGIFENFTSLNPSTPITPTNSIFETEDEDCLSLTEIDPDLKAPLIDVINKLSFDIIEEAMFSINGVDVDTIPGPTEKFRYLDDISEKTNEDYDESTDSQSILDNKPHENFEIDSKPIENLQLETDIRNLIKEIVDYDEDETESEQSEPTNDECEPPGYLTDDLLAKSTEIQINDHLEASGEHIEITRKLCKTNLTEYLTAPDTQSTLKGTPSHILRQQEQEAWEEMNEQELRVINADYNSSGSEYEAADADDELAKRKYYGPFFDVDLCCVTENPPEITSDSDTNLGARGDVTSGTTQTAHQDVTAQSKEDEIERDTKIDMSAAEATNMSSRVPSKKKKWSLGYRIISLFTRNKPAASTQ